MELALKVESKCKYALEFFVHMSGRIPTFEVAALIGSRLLPVWAMTDFVGKLIFMYRTRP